MMSRKLQFRTVDGFMSTQKAGIEVPPEGQELLRLLERPLPQLQIAQATGRWQQHWGSLHRDLGGNWLRIAVRAAVLGIGRTGLPRIAQLWTVNPDRFDPIAPTNDEEWLVRYMPVRGDRQLRKQYPNGVPVDDVVHVMFANPVNPFWGVGLVDTAAVAMDNGIESREHNLATVRKGATPAMALIVRGLGNKNWQEVRNKVDTDISGRFNAGKMLILPGEGFEIKQLGLNPEQMQLFELLGLTDQDVATMHGVPIELVSKKSTKFDDLEVRLWQEHQDLNEEAVEIVECESQCLLPEYLDPNLWRLVPAFSDAQIKAVQAKRFSEAYQRLVDSGVPPRDASTMLGLDFGEGWDGWERPVVNAARVDLADLVAGEAGDRASDL